MFKRILSTFLVILMLASSLTLVINAEEAESGDAPATEGPVYEYNTNKTTPTMNYWDGETIPKPGEDPVVVDTDAKKLELMDLRLEQSGFRMYVDEYSGEVAIENIATGDVMFSNPYNVANVSEEYKKEYLSQILIDYQDLSNRESIGDFYYSYEHGVKGGVLDSENPSQLNVKHIKNGLRVEYSIGRLDTRYLVPERISEDDFKEMILDVALEAGCTEFEGALLKNFFIRKSLEDHLKQFKTEETIAAQTEDFLKKYPEAEKQPIMVFTGTTKKEYKDIESIIKRYCPDFTYEILDTIYLELNYKPADQNEALFNISLEYTIDENGFSVRVPANGIRFDESLYLLEHIQILPFMGAGQNPNSGYTLFPDGAGTLFDFQELAAKGGETHFYGACYGEDFAYYNLASGAPHNETVRYPVFGLKEDIVDADGNEHSRGFVAIVEEGEALMTFDSSHTAEYNSVRMRVNPRPYDQYKMSDAISVAGDAMWTVVSPRKYTGNFVIHYIMLTDPDVSTGDGCYDTSYVGMAAAYRDYLVEKGILTKLTDADIKEDLPLYIETFGAIETTEKFLSIPYDSMKPLTSFEDISKMYDELAENGIENINFILTGYSKGGLTVDLMPNGIDWDSAVEKEMKFEELVEYAKTNGFGIYPDFDFVFVADNELFDGMTLYSHAIKAIDGRYTSKREYSATRQSYVSYFELAMSPAYFSNFYKNVTKQYLKSEPIGISVSSLGTYLNSDFDEDEPYNREDSKEFTIEAFEYFNQNYSKVLTSGGNAYTWKYVDYITDIATDSSRHARSSATVPFLGIVLHGYVQYAGEAINMEGNIDYAMLRAIENGASLKFILSYQNTEKLKEYQSTSKYYSVRYDIWLEELIERYNDINAALSDVQLNTIIHHEFIDGVRVPNEDEIDGDAANALQNAINSEIAGAATDKENLRSTIQAIKSNLEDCNANMKAITNGTDPNVKSIQAMFDEAQTLYADIESALADVAYMQKELEDAKEYYKDSDKYDEQVKIYQDKYNIALRNLSDEYNEYMAAVNAAINLGQSYVDKYEMARDNFSLLDSENIYLKDVIPALEAIRDDLSSTYVALKAKLTTLRVAVTEKVADIEEKYAEELGLTEKPEEEAQEYNKYAASKNSIVYEVYDSGKAFVLNFNNYAVKVEIGGAYYTIGAYDYIVLI